jgi:hypothetical protein
MHASSANDKEPQKAKRVPPQHVLDDTKFSGGTVLGFLPYKEYLKNPISDFQVH